MSGIAGIYHADGQPVDSRDIRRMLERIAHRGPDGARAWSSGPIGLGHCMLWTTPESLREQQPMSSADGQLWLTADARLDNRDELRSDLVARGAEPRTDTDAELILRSYEVWGEECPARLIGDFAFAIWDARQQQLFCARDPIGIKGFCYHFDGKTFRWASAPQAIFAAGTLRPQLNRRLICLALLNRFDDPQETLYEGVLRLAPAHSLVVKGDRVRTTRYWDVEPRRTVRHRTDAEYAEHFLHLFRTAVAARLRSHGPVGAMLSGGLDSSSVVCVAQQLCREGSGPRSELETFSIVFDELPCDERPYMDAVTRKSGVRSNQISHEKDTSWLNFERTGEYPDCFYNPTLFMIGPALAQARQQGIRTMLTGIGGDDLLASSMAHLTDLLHERRIAHLFRQLHADAELSSRSRLALFRDYCVRPLIPRMARVIIRSFIKAPRSTPVPSWLNGEYIGTNGVHLHATNGVRFPTCAQQRIYDNLVSGWNTNVALESLGSFAAHSSIECRHPFFDRRLVEFLFAVPEEQRWGGRWRKAVLRRAMAGILPESVRRRTTKTDFSAVVDRELKERQAGEADRLLEASILGDLGAIRVAEFRKVIDEYRHGPISHNARRACHNFIRLELWCRSALRPATN